MRRHRSHLSLHRLLHSAASIYDKNLKGNPGAIPSDGSDKALSQSHSQDACPSSSSDQQEASYRDQRRSFLFSLHPPSFFIKLRRWLSMTRAKPDSSHLVDRLEKTFSVSRVVFDKFAVLFEQLFHETPESESPVEGDGGSASQGTSGKSVGSDHFESAAESTVPSLRRETRTYGKRGRNESANDSTTNSALHTSVDSDVSGVPTDKAGESVTGKVSEADQDESSPALPSLEEVRRYTWTLFVHVKSTFPAIAADLVNRYAGHIYFSVENQFV